MELGLSGKTVLIAGGTKGIGLACAQAFHSEGAKVAITSREASNIAAARMKLGNAVIGIPADLIHAQQAAATVAEAEREIGPIDILVNSAGAAKRIAPADLTPAAWRAAMDAKYFTAINLIDPVIKSMAARGQGVIINIIGNGGKAANAAHVPGGAANAALMLATAGLGAAYAPRGVRVVGVNPGTTNTGRVAQGMQANAKLDGISPDEALRRTIARIPMGRMAEPEEIAAAVVFLASAKASYITGVTITMDGAANPFVV
jgi:NAD(P)-dependent dehydrogenase (short-subunit alcohol dehydrogenase family)